MIISTKEKIDIINNQINYKQNKLSELRSILTEQILIENNDLMTDKLSSNISLIETEITALQQILDDLL